MNSGTMMRFGQAVRSILKKLSRTTREEKIEFSDRLYMRACRGELTLVSLGIENVQAMRLLIADATAIFRSIKSACDMQEVVEIKVGELSWKTDARLQSTDRDRMIIEFNGPSGFGREVVKRDRVIAALADFKAKFGLS